MQFARLCFAPDPRQFGRRRPPVPAAPAITARNTPGSDLKLFATTFLAGFVFVSILLA
jgi:hypothetical protein